MRVPRFVVVAGARTIQLHFLSDASEKAYGACVYIRTQVNDDIQVQLMASKSKVAPLKARHSIARLELCAAVLSTQLYKKVTESLTFNAFVNFCFDSMTVLHWLNAIPATWKPFCGTSDDKNTGNNTIYLLEPRTRCGQSS